MGQGWLHPDRCQGHVRSAFAALFQKVKMWRDECFKQATEALETGEPWFTPAEFGRVCWNL